VIIDIKNDQFWTLSWEKHDFIQIEIIYCRAKNFGASVPTVILSKYDDSLQPYAKFDDKFTLQNLQDFVDNNKLPKLVW
jgi:hypothetical protein